MRWMHPLYAPMREAMDDPRLGETQREQIRLNLERIRAIPAIPQGRHILVDAASAMLWMYEDGEIVDSMKVVVGKPKNPTPMMAALVRFASLNPYWYVPPDLASERIAPNVLKEGLPYLERQGYQLFSNWNDEATLLDPATIDWRAVADGASEIYVRQLPGPANAMGIMKFMFPNSKGVYLHDTPQKELLTEASRMFSGGCVRLEDAPRLARWLFGSPLQPESNQPELRVDLPEPVPVYITYLTVIPEGQDLATFPDVYGRDRDGLALSGQAVTAAR
jgi:murein L,D-transpeptidase YcbB/YkuD